MCLADSRSFPGALDTLAGGGCDVTRTVFETAVSETHEEAGLAAAFVRAHLRPCSVVSLDQSDQPSINYCFDLQLRPEQMPTPLDGEVESFQLFSAHELLDAVHAGAFTPDAALAVVDFAIRHALVNPQNEPRYASLCCAMCDQSVIPAGL